MYRRHLITRDLRRIVARLHHSGPSASGTDMLYRHDHCYPRFESFLSAVAERRLVLDLGTYHAHRKELSAHRSLFKNSYFTMDVSSRNGDPDVVGDIGELPFRSGSVDAIICKEVLEHVKDPFRAVAEMRRVLKDGGLVFSTVPFLHPYHGARGKLPDLWRFTEEGVAELFSGFSSLEIQRAGGILFVARAFSPVFLRKALSSRVLSPLVNAVDRLSLRWGASHLFLILARR